MFIHFVSFFVACVSLAHLPPGVFVIFLERGKGVSQPLQGSPKAPPGPPRHSCVYGDGEAGRYAISPASAPHDARASSSLPPAPRTVRAGGGLQSGAPTQAHQGWPGALRSSHLAPRTSCRQCPCPGLPCVPRATPSNDSVPEDAVCQSGTKPRGPRDQRAGSS